MARMPPIQVPICFISLFPCFLVFAWFGSFLFIFFFSSEEEGGVVSPLYILYRGLFPPCGGCVVFWFCREVGERMGRKKPSQERVARILEKAH